MHTCTHAGTLVCTHLYPSTHMQNWQSRLSAIPWKAPLNDREQLLFRTRSHTCMLFLPHTDIVLSEQICILILMLLVVYASDYVVWSTHLVHFVAIKGNPHPAVLSAEGYRCINCYKIIELLKQAVNTPEELAVQDEHVLIIYPQGILD